MEPSRGTYGRWHFVSTSTVGLDGRRLTKHHRQSMKVRSVVVRLNVEGGVDFTYTQCARMRSREEICIGNRLL